VGGNLRVETLTWLEPQKQINYYPTARIDYRVRPTLSFMGSYNRYNQRAEGRRVWPFPEFPINSDTFDSGWWVFSTGTDMTLKHIGADKVREFIAEIGLHHTRIPNSTRQFLEGWMTQYVAFVKRHVATPGL